MEPPPEQPIEPGAGGGGLVHAGPASALQLPLQPSCRPQLSTTIAI
jgi:hypothetical protein